MTGRQVYSILQLCECGHDREQMFKSCYDVIWCSEHMPLCTSAWDVHKVTVQHRRMTMRKATLGSTRARKAREGSRTLLYVAMYSVYLSIYVR